MHNAYRSLIIGICCENSLSKIFYISKITTWSRSRWKRC